MYCWISFIKLQRVSSSQTGNTKHLGFYSQQGIQDTLISFVCRVINWVAPSISCVEPIRDNVLSYRGKTVLHESYFLADLVYFDMINSHSIKKKALQGNAYLVALMKRQKYFMSSIIRYITHEHHQLYQLD